MPTKFHEFRRLLLPLGTLALGVSLMAMPTPQNNHGAPDNTRQNQDHSVTADQQNMHHSDREITQHIRKSVTEDKTLSTYGHNVKVISEHGKVTLRGPVRSDEERKNIHSKAAREVGEQNVDDRMEVAPPKQHR